MIPAGRLFRYFKARLQLHMVKMAKKIAALFIIYAYVCVCICVCIRVCVCMNWLVVADPLIFPKYPLQKIFFIFLVHSFNINQTSET